MARMNKLQLHIKSGESYKCYEQKQLDTNRAYSVISFTLVSKKRKLICGIRSQKIDFPCEDWGKCLEWVRGSCWDANHVVFLDLGTGYMGVFTL